MEEVVKSHCRGAAEACVDRVEGGDAIVARHGQQQHLHQTTDRILSLDTQAAGAVPSLYETRLTSGLSTKADASSAR